MKQPVHARCCGAGDKDRRAIDPPPVVELQALRNGQMVDPTDLAAMVFVVYVSLWSEDGKEPIKSSPRIPRELSLMVGDLVVPPSVAQDEQGRLCCLFVFLMNQGLRMPIRKYRMSNSDKNRETAEDKGDGPSEDDTYGGSNYETSNFGGDG
ncbi:hypothetical protein HDU96_008681 [Phlyctochytrium bullatum]|nr:hypothetical protein HDU96_008681 [Phlyctochytrium bullatum]